MLLSKITHHCILECLIDSHVIPPGGEGSNEMERRGSDKLAALGCHYIILK